MSKKSKRKFTELSRPRRVGGDPDGRFWVFTRSVGEEVWGHVVKFNLERDAMLHTLMRCWFGQEVLLVDSEDWSAWMS